MKQADVAELTYEIRSVGPIPVWHPNTSFSKRCLGIYGNKMTWISEKYGSSINGMCTIVSILWDDEDRML